MADIKVSQLTEQLTATNDDLVEVVVNAATVPASKKMKRSTLVAGLATEASLASHEANTTNPHGVTAAQVGAPTSATLTAHTGNVSNPHSVTKTQVGLSNVDNTSDLAKPVSTATQTALDTKANTAHTQAASTITDFDAEVANNTAVTANTAKISYPSADATKLAGIAVGATANDTDANLKNRANHTGTQSADTLTDGATNKAYTATEKTKLAAITGTNTGDQSLNSLLPVQTGNAGKSLVTDGANAAWTTVSGGTGAVDSVNGQTGVVVLTQDNVGDGTTNKQYSATEKTKLAGVATGATANDTDANLKARANHSGTQTASTISDFSTAADARISAAAGVSVASLSSGKVPTAQLPAVSLTSVQTAVSQVAMLALTTQEGDVVVRTDENKTYMRNSGVAGTMADYTLLNTPTDAVTSVNTQTGAVVLAKADIGLANVDNTADTAKPVSTAQQTALDTKAATTHAHAAADVTSGVFDIGRLATGTPDGTKFVRDDGTLVTPAGGGMTNPMTTQGDVIYGGTSGAPTRLAKGTAGQVWTMNAAATAPEWATAAGGGGASTPRYTRFFPAPANNDFWVAGSASGGTFTFATSSAYMRLATNTTAGGNVQTYFNLVSAHINKAAIMKNPHFTAALGVLGAVGNGSCWFRFFDSGGAPGTGTANQIGLSFPKSAGVIATNASNGNGTTETSTALTMTLSAPTAQVYSAIMADGIDIKFYANGSLKATHTTNLPLTGATDFRQYLPDMKVQNDSTTDNYVLDYYYMNMSAESY